MFSQQFSPRVNVLPYKSPQLWKFFIMLQDKLSSFKCKCAAHTRQSTSSIAVASQTMSNRYSWLPLALMPLMLNGVVGAVSEPTYRGVNQLLKSTQSY
jgi:hypothetical protein